MATIKFSNGKTVNFNGNPSPDDVEEVAKTLGIQPDVKPAPTSGGGLIPSLGPIAPAGENDNPIEAGAKTAINMVPSAINAGTGIVNSAISGLEHIGDIPGAVKDAYKASGGLGGFLKNTAEGLYETLVPEGTRSLIKGDTKGAQKSITNDPVGNILPYIMLGREAAYKASPEAGAAFDSSVSSVANKSGGVKAVNTIASIPGKIVGAAGSLGKFGIGQATGLDPSTITQIESTPSEFSKKSQANISRPSVASEIKDALDQRENDLSETGQAYKPIRNASGGTPAMINVDPDFLKTTIEKTTGTTVDAKTGRLNGGTGEIKTSGGAGIRDAKDVRALQSFYNTWQPIFEQGQMTPNEFLNMRSDLAKLSKFDREISKSGDLEAATKAMRANLNNEYRDQIPGLENTDAQYSSQISELNDLRKGILDKNGELTDAGINKIANASNKGRSVFLNQIEQISPGITTRVKILKAIEDIENTHGQKVGTYFRAVAGGSGATAALMAGNIPALAGIIATTIMTSPDVAIPLIRAYGNVKGLTEAVVAKLKAGAGAVNQLPQGKGSIFPRQEIPLGIPRKNTFTGQPPNPTIHL